MSTAWIAAFVALSIAVVLLAFVVIGTLRRVLHALELVEEHLRRGALNIGGLAPGSAVPEFHAWSEEGHQFTSQDLGDQTVVLLFLSSACPPCRSIAAQLRSRRDDVAAELVYVLGDPEERVELDVPQHARVVYQDAGAVSAAFQISGTPHAFVITDGYVTAGGAPNTVADLQDMMERSEGGWKQASRPLAIVQPNHDST